MSFEPEKACPRCGYPRLEAWDELDADERFVFERLSPPEGVTPEQRKKHRFCKRCLYEQGGREPAIA